MTLDLDVVRSRWTEERPSYEVYTKGVVEDLGKVVAAIGLPIVRLEGRAKEVESFIQKIADPKYTAYEQVKDKAGARVVVHLQSDVDRAVDAIAKAYSCTPGDVEDHRLVTDENVERFEYRAVHVQVRGRLSGDEGDKECEVQVRTVCEDAWAVMSHFLAYKPAEAASAQDRRAHAALSALFELADREYERQYVSAWHGASVARDILQGLAPDFIRLTGGHEYDPAISESIIDVLLPLWEPPTGVVESVLALVNQHEAGLKSVFQTASDERSAYLFQPAALLIFERLAAGSGADLAELWSRAGLPLRELERIAADFKLSLD